MKGNKLLVYLDIDETMLDHSKKESRWNKYVPEFIKELVNLIKLNKIDVMWHTMWFMEKGPNETFVGDLLGLDMGTDVIYQLPENCSLEDWEEIWKEPRKLFLYEPWDVTKSDLWKHSDEYSDFVILDDYLWEDEVSTLTSLRESKNLTTDWNYLPINLKYNEEALLDALTKIKKRI